jgi:hypothetical protein
MKKSAALILLMIMTAWSVLAQTSADPAAMFLRANDSYLQGDYPSAEVLYRKILDAGIRNGKVYYNLGNTLFRLGKTGEAIQNYLLAQQFLPRSEDLEANLGYARQKAEDRIEVSSSGALRDIFFWYNRLSVKEMAWIFLVCNILFWSGLTLRLFLPYSAVKWLVLLSLIGAVTMGGTAAVRVISEHREQPAVVIAREVSVQSGIDPESTTLFVLHDGAEVSVEKVSNDWSLIRFASGKKGWVKNEQLGLAVP